MIRMHWPWRTTVSSTITKHHTKATEVAVFRVANCEELPPKSMRMELH